MEPEQGMQPRGELASLPPEQMIERLCRLARDHKSGPRSIQDLLEESGFRDLRRTIRAEHLRRHLWKRMDLVDNWLDYSCDKRTAGYYFREHAGRYEVGMVAPDGGIAVVSQHRDPARACAEFILLELMDIGGFKADKTPADTILDKLLLRAALDAIGTRPDAYDLDGGTPSECYCLVRREDRWVVSYSERGEINEIASFATEHEACAFFLDLMRSEPTTRTG